MGPRLKVSLCPQKEQIGFVKLGWGSGKDFWVGIGFNGKEGLFPGRPFFSFIFFSFLLNKKQGAAKILSYLVVKTISFPQLIHYKRDNELLRPD